MIESAGSMLDDEGQEQAIVDVWSRTARKYRRRAVLLLGLNMLMFLGLGCFTYWVRTGTFWVLGDPNYWEILSTTFMPRGEATLANFVQFPISLDKVPLHGVVVGLLLAALVSVPILIAILYRLVSALPFILVVAFVAVMPWLAIAILGACILATVPPLRFRFRFASALLGLLLVMVYFYGASRQTTPLVEQIQPEARIKFMAPWILATIASCVIMGGVLGLARLVNYRPGVVAPLLFISFAVPVAVFEQQVGRDELYYRLLERDVHDALLERDVSQWFERTVYAAYVRRPNPKPPFLVFRQQAELHMSLELEASTDILSVFAQTRQDLIDACDWFVRYFPTSRYAPNVLFLKGEVMDTRVDQTAFRERKILRFYDDFALNHPDAPLIWRKVIANAPKSSISAVGRYKLAILLAREGDFDEALAVLDEAIALYANPAEPGEPNTTTEAVKQALTVAPADASLKIPFEQTVFNLRHLRYLLARNAKDPRYGSRPFCGSREGEDRRIGLLQLDSQAPHYPRQLERLREAYPKCLLEDNLAVLQALAAESPSERIARLQGCVEAFPDGDAVAEAYYRLGIALQGEGRIVDARAAYEHAVARDEGRLWTPLASDRLRRLTPVSGEGPA